MIRLSPRISFISGRVHSGKTTRAASMINGKIAGGFLTPEVDGKKMLLDLVEDTYYNFEADASDEKIVSVGKYFLDKNAFVRGGELLQRDLRNEVPIIFIDEIGILELRNEGFHPHLEIFFDLLRNREQVECVILVRDYLLTQVIDKYGLDKL